jgi:hypothetical protein
MPRRLLFAACLVLAAASARGRTRIKLDVDLRHDRLTRFRKVRRFGWHSGFHYAPYVDEHGRWRCGWHRGSHQDWYTIDVPALSEVDRADWQVFVRFGKGKHLRVRGDLNRRFRHSTVVKPIGGNLLDWVRRDGTVITGGPGHRRRQFLAPGWCGFNLGNGVIMMDVPGSSGVEVYLKQRTKELVDPEKKAAVADVKGRPRPGRNAKLDRLLDEGDRKFVLGLYPQAALLYQKAMSLDETDALARFAVSHCLFALGVYKTAGRNVRRGLDRFPDWGLVSLDLTKFYRNDATFLEQLLKLRRYVAEHPEDLDARLLLGYCYYFSGKREAALDRFRALADLPGGDKHAELFLKLADYDPGPPDEDLPGKNQ